jgi:hypothetical protein
LPASPRRRPTEISVKFDWYFPFGQATLMRARTAVIYGEPQNSMLTLMRRLRLLVIPILAATTVPARPASIAIAPLKKLDVAKAFALNSPDNHERYLRLHKLFDFAGCSQTYMQELKVSHAAEPDIVCSLPGTLTPASGPDPKRLIVIARYDHIGPGTGAIDNWSGAAMLPLVFASVLPGYREHTIQFVATFGSSGLRTFLKSLNRQQKESATALVDLRDVGMGPARVGLLFSDASDDDASMLGKGNTSGKVTLATKDSSDAAQSAARTARTQSDSSGSDGRDLRIFAMRETAALTKLDLPVLANPYVEGFMSAKPETAKDEVDFILETSIPGVVIHSVTKMNATIPGSKADTVDLIDQPAYYATYYFTAVYLLVLDHPIVKTP